MTDRNLMVKIYTGTIKEQEDAFEADLVEAARLGWEPIRREEAPDSLQVTYRIAGSDVPMASAWKT